MKLRIDNQSGQLTHVILPDRTINLNVQFYYWTGCYGDNTNTTQRSSGAYIFRPKTDKPYEIRYKNAGHLQGPVVTEVRANSEQNAFSVVRIYNGLGFIEHDFVVGPINVDDNDGKEYVVRYETNVNNKNVFYTDSNGRQMLKRILNRRYDYNVTLEEPIAGNYYPITNEISIEDENNKVSVLTDRSVGGTSLNNGDLEVMVHRRLLHDDAFGVGEALNETVNGIGLVVRGSHRILNINPKNNDEIIKERRSVIEMHLKPIIFVSNSEHVTYETWVKLNNCYKGIKPLPLGLHLLTLEPWVHNNKVLIRFENYLPKSDKSDIELDISDIFNNIKVKSIKETTLAANRWLDETEKWVWNKQNDFADSFNKAYGVDSLQNDGMNKNNDESKIDDEVKHTNEDLSANGIKIKIKAKQIRTFIADIEYISV